MLLATSCWKLETSPSVFWGDLGFPLRTLVSVFAVSQLFELSSRVLREDVSPHRHSFMLVSFVFFCFLSCCRQGNVRSDFFLS